jgi:glycerophosphoryl diester phosphodiesterase
VSDEAFGERAERGAPGDFGEALAGPPWILGHRGSPWEAPENTLAGMRRAIDLGLDGFEYDLRACGTGEAVLFHDRTLERTTDAHGPLDLRSLPELFGIDAGSWFSRQYVGEPVPVFDEVLEIAGSDTRGWPQHMIEIKERGITAQVAEKLNELAPHMPVYIASFLRDVVLEARDLGLRTMLLAVRADEGDRRFVRDEKIDSHGVGPGGWRTAAGRDDWSFCERWGWSADDPDDLLEACRELVGFNTNEPQRALATRALLSLAPDDDGAYPVRTEVLNVEPETLPDDVRERGEWFGRWSTHAYVRNPFPFRVDVGCGVFVRNGAFELEGLPARFELEPGEELAVPFKIVGGARRPAGDPLFGALFHWKAGPGRPLGRLLLDAPIRRTRFAVADAIARRLTLLNESPRDAAATMNLRRHGAHILVEIENDGGLQEAHTVVHLAGETARGGRGLRARLPEDFDATPNGVPFSCGIEGLQDGVPVVRRWAGGVPEGLLNGRPGRLIPLTTS